MARIARLHVLFGLAFALLGMALGIYMAASQDHVQHVTHAHILLLGFVVSVLYGVVYRLWIDDAPPLLARVQLALHQAGTLSIAVGLFLLFGGQVPPAALDPLLSAASLAVLASAALTGWMVLRAGRPATARPAPQAQPRQT